MNLLNDAAQLVGLDNGQKSLTEADFQQNGFIVPSVPNADGNGLPASKIKPGRKGKFTRHLAHWFVPEVGVIPMFINPQSIVYGNTKLINKERTKGGFSIQYWGEDLSELSIDGHTGSSGVEGLNVLYEVYRAENYMFDAVGLQMAADSSVSGIADMVNSAVGNLGGIAGIGGSLLGGAAGLLAGGASGSGESVLPKDVPSLSAMATGIELFYAGWIFRGYFNSFSFTESIDHMGFFKYSIKFMVTQKRGYRVNEFGWQHSPNSTFGAGGSSSDTPHSFNGLKDNKTDGPIGTIKQ